MQVRESLYQGMGVIAMQAAGVFAAKPDVRAVGARSDERLLVRRLVLT